MVRIAIFRFALSASPNVEGFNESRICFPIRRIIIDANANVIACFNIKTSFGNLLEKSFEEIWNGEAYRTFRQRLVEANLLPICKACPYAKLLTPVRRSPVA